MSGKASLNSRASIRRHVIVGCALVAFLGVGLGGWASTAEISGALIAPRLAGRRFQRQEGAAPDRRRRRRGSRARRRPGQGRRYSHSPRRNRDARQSGDRHQGSHRALCAQGAARRRARRRRYGRGAQGACGRRRRPRRARRRSPASASCSICGARRGSARRINCSSASSNCASRSAGLPPSRTPRPRKWR